MIRELASDHSKNIRKWWYQDIYHRNNNISANSECWALVGEIADKTEMVQLIADK